ncbi:Protein kinase domain-containing protein [Entamoeba marina]
MGANVSKKKKVNSQKQKDVPAYDVYSPMPAVQRKQFVRISQSQPSITSETYKMKTFSSENLRNREKRIKSELKTYYKELISSNLYELQSGPNDIDDLKKLQYIRTVENYHNLFLVEDRSSNINYLLYYRSLRNNSSGVGNFPKIPYVPEPTHIFRSTNSIVFLMKSGMWLPLKDVVSFNNFTESHAKIFAAQIIVMLSSMLENGSQGVGITIDNILVDESGFIIGNILSMMRDEQTNVLPEYLSPESCISDTIDDWWNVGVVIYYMLAKNFPFNGNTSFTTFCDVISGNRLTLPNDISKNAEDFILKILHQERDKRLNETTIREHSWFEGIDWNGVSQMTVTNPIKFGHTNSSYN